MALKWLVIGRYQPRVEPLWSIWVRCTELISGLYENLMVPVSLNLLSGTPWGGMILRLSLPEGTHWRGIPAVPWIDVEPATTPGPVPSTHHRGGS
ncbi:hypothetical protein [Actinopolymorpha alba]|uniref:hypothetical protein n=1 Tax=Actinopolymorpha alba TaxID=533267 RepID=UPI00036C73D5|nr:hypothetical protein [Actinopolymorpha alba]